PNGLHRGGELGLIVGPLRAAQRVTNIRARTMTAIATPPAANKPPRPPSGGRKRRLLTAIGLSLALAAVVAYAIWPRHGLGRRVASTTVKLPLSAPGGVAWKTVNAFPQLKFFEPTCVAAARDGSNRLFVLERRGTIQ